MIAIGSDHGGFELKGHIIEHLKEKGIEVKDFGTYSEASVDYPTVQSLYARLFLTVNVNAVYLSAVQV